MSIAVPWKLHRDVELKEKQPFLIGCFQILLKAYKLHIRNPVEYTWNDIDLLISQLLIHLSGSCVDGVGIHAQFMAAMIQGILFIEGHKGFTIAFSFA